MLDLAHVLNAFWFSQMLQSHGWVWPVLEITHLLGLVMMFAALIIVDLRILGFSKTIPLNQLDTLIPLALIGFAVNVVTGSMLVLGDPHHFLPNEGFQAKLVLIALAGVNALYFTFKIRPKINATSKSLDYSAKVSAGASLALWISVTALARFIAFIESY